MNKTVAIIVLATGLVGTGAVMNMPATEPAHEVTVVQINAKWNRYNNREDLENLDGCEYRFGWLEDQPYELRKTIKSVPVVVIYDEGKPAYQYVAGISLELDTPFDTIQNQVWKELDD